MTIKDYIFKLKNHELLTDKDDDAVASLLEELDEIRNMAKEGKAGAEND